MCRDAEPTFEWFTTWVNQRLMLCLTFVRGRSWQETIEGFGLAPETTRSLTFDEAADELGTTLRAGEVGGWGYVVEDLPTQGFRPEVLCRLSEDGSEAMSLSYTPTINLFTYAADGALVNRFDLTVPRIRHGSDRHRFDAEMEAAGFRHGAVPDPPSMGARFLQLTFGITLTADLLERPLPTVLRPTA